MKGKKYLWILPIVFLFTVVMAHIPVHASSTVSVYVSMPGSYIPGKPVGTVFDIDIYVESPPEWENTADGIVGLRIYVKVDPEILEPLTVRGAMGGYFLYDFIDKYGYYGHEPSVLFEINKKKGLFSDITEMLMAWEALGVGAGGSGKLCTLKVKSLSEECYSPIDIFEAYYYTPAGKFSVDVVVDGHYNEKVHDVAVVDIIPITDHYIAEVYPGWVIDVDVTVKNEGGFNETFDVTLYYGVSAIGTETVTDLAPCRSVNVTFTWDTAGLTEDLKTNSTGEAEVVPGEIDTADNILSELIKVKLAGDAVEPIEKVDWRDLFALAAAYGSEPGDDNWNQQCDFDQSNKVDWKDLFALAANYGTTYDC